MKYIVVLSDGMAGEPLEELGGMTTMEAAHTPTLDALAPMSEVGCASMVPEGMSPGSDTANLAVLGYDPKLCYSGRSPLEALSIGVQMSDTDVSFRCNLVTLSQGDEAYGKRTILDHSSGEIATQDAAVLVEALQKELAPEGYHFYPGTSYRNLLVVEHGELLDMTPPHDILGKQIGPYLPADATFRGMMERSYDILRRHPLNLERVRNGQNPANSAWFWGAGRRPALSSFAEKTGKRGVMVSAVDLLKGIAIGSGLKPLIVEGANGGLHTNYEGKAMAAAQALTHGGYDFAYIHIEAPDEMGHQGNIANKVESIGRVDQKVVAPVIKAMEDAGEDFRLMVLPDHPTPIAVRTHTMDAVPYLLYDSTRAAVGPESFCERTARGTGIYFKDGYKLMARLLEG
ncbi:MAG: cofactor-independent phosphoglycerate mutase [Lachnospiraceae bacterium]|jgi:2,3-bisphosphoglycerate-independent phosphoglycerate mutase|nr:cofactor-independent phosphoglycerate mutase [Lachnospiraceae bacterium]